MKDQIRDSIKEHLENGRKIIQENQAKDLEFMQKKHEENLVDQKRHLEEITRNMENELKKKNELQTVMESLNSKTVGI